MKPLLSVQEVHTAKPAHDAALNGVSFDVRAGEILGIAGVEGNGQSVLAETLIGTIASTAGQITVLGVDSTKSNVSRRREAGVAFVSEDRQAEGLPINSTVVEGMAADRIRNIRGFLSFW